MSIKFYEKSGGYNLDLFVGKSQHELDIIMCGICHEVYRDPKQCCIGHVYCGSCVESLISVSLEVGKNCPECRKFCESWNPNLFLKNHIESMQVRCVSKLSEAKDLKVVKCEWQGPLCTLQRHVDTECQLTSVMCGLVGCEAQMIRADLPDHEQHCLFRLTKCIYCESKVTILARLQHQETCDLRPVSCDQNCGKRMTVNQLNAHKAQDCPNTVVNCPMFLLVGDCNGCAGKVERCKLQLHLTNHIALSSLLNHCAELTECNSQLTQELYHTKKKYVALQAVTKMKFIIADLQRERQLFAQTSDKRCWQHDAMLCEMLEKWNKVYEASGDAETINQIIEQLSIVNDDDDIVVRQIAVEFTFKELSWTRIDVPISDTMKLTVSLRKLYSTTTAEFRVTLSIWPTIRIALPHYSVVQFQKPALVVLPLHCRAASSLRSTFSGTTANSTETVRLLCTVHMSKSEFKKHNVKLYGDCDAK